MKVKKMGIPVFGTLGAIILAFNVIAFILADELTKQFWSGYVFVTLSWLFLVMISVRFAAQKDFSGYSMFLAAPQILIAMICFLFQMIVGIAVMAIPDFSLIASIVIQVVLLTIFLIVEFGVLAYKGVATRAPQKTQAKVAFKKDLGVDIENAINRCKNSELKQKLDAISEDLKYSDPVSSEATAIYEDRIFELFSQVKSHLYEEEKSTALSLCDEIIQLINQRNAVCAANKAH